MSKNGYTMAELDALPLIPLERGQDTIGFVHVDHPLWDGNISSFMNAIADPANRYDEYLAVRRCSSSMKMNTDRIFFDFSMFPVTVNKGKAKWETSIRVVKNAVRQEQREKFRAQNLSIVRMYVTGSPEGRITCPKYGIPLDEIEENGNIFSNWVQHHFRFLNKISVHKENADPGAILANYDFTQVTPRSREGLKDMARTIFLSSSYHDLLHKARRDGDIRDYLNSELPWAIRNADNWQVFNEYLERFGHDPLGEYDSWFTDQMN